MEAFAGCQEGEDVGEEQIAQDDVVDVGRKLVEFESWRCHDVEVSLMSR